MSNDKLPELPENALQLFQALGEMIRIEGSRPYYPINTGLLKKLGFRTGDDLQQAVESLHHYAQHPAWRGEAPLICVDLKDGHQALIPGPHCKVAWSRYQNRGFNGASY